MYVPSLQALGMPPVARRQRTGIQPAYITEFQRRPVLGHTLPSGRCVIVVLRQELAEEEEHWRRECKVRPFKVLHNSHAAPA